MSAEYRSEIFNDDVSKWVKILDWDEKPKRNIQTKQTVAELFEWKTRWEVFELTMLNRIQTSVVGVVVNFSQFYLLLQNHWTTFNQNLAQSILGWWGFKFVQMKGLSFSKGKLLRKSENTLTKLKKSSSPEPLGHYTISTKLGTMHPCMKGIQVCSNEEPLNSHKVKKRFFLLLINVMI